MFRYPKFPYWKKSQFIYNAKDLIPDMKIGQNGLSNQSKITVIDSNGIIGA